MTDVLIQIAGSLQTGDLVTAYINLQARKKGIALIEEIITIEGK